MAARGQQLAPGDGRSLGWCGAPGHRLHGGRIDAEMAVDSTRAWPIDGQGAVVEGEQVPVTARMWIS